MTSRNPDLGPSRAFARELIAKMTLAEKAGQMTQIEKNSITPDDVAEFAIGSVLSGGGGNPDPNTPETWAQMVHEYVDAGTRSRLGVPVLYGTDAVHGHSNVVGATIFPHNIGLGATADAELVERVYRAGSLEVAATGARWNFAPTVAVSLDPRWGRTYESFGDDTELVTELGAAAVRGLQGSHLSDSGSVLACAKHFVGDGGTTWGSVTQTPWNDWWDGWGDQWQIDQGDLRVDEAELRAIHLPPYEQCLATGALSVMASYSSWNGDRLHSHHYLLSELLKGELGFEGFVVSDWFGLDQLDPDSYVATVRGINAGVDMAMVPFDYRGFIGDVVTAVDAGDIDVERVDDAVVRILTVKHALGLFAQNQQPAPAIDMIGHDDHRQLARDAAAASAVRLIDTNDVLPICEGTVLVAGAAADDVGLQCGGWTIEWLGSPGPITPGSTILEGLRERPSQLDVHYDANADFSTSTIAPVGIVVIAEPPYAEGGGDRELLQIATSDLALVERMRPQVEQLVVVLLSGRPLVLGSVAELADAIVAGWLPGSEGAGIADVLTGAKPFRGRLPRRWPASDAQVASPREDWNASWERGHGVVS